MINDSLLKGRMAELGVTQENLAHKLNITAQSLRNKIQGKTAFTLSEIRQMVNCLEITNELRDRIFFD